VHDKLLKPQQSFRITLYYQISRTQHLHVTLAGYVGYLQQLMVGARFFWLPLNLHLICPRVSERKFDIVQSFQRKMRGRRIISITTHLALQSVRMS
jgi:hypothetical protein